MRTWFVCNGLMMDIFNTFCFQQIINTSIYKCVFNACFSIRKCLRAIEKIKTKFNVPALFMRV